MIDKHAEVGLFLRGRQDSDGPSVKSFSISMRTDRDRAFSEATRERPKKKPTSRKFVGFLEFLVGRAGFEPATTEENILLIQKIREISQL